MLEAYGARWRDVTEEDRRHPSVRSSDVGFVCVDVTLRRNSDGVERVIVDDHGFSVDTCGRDVNEAIDGARYWWTEGNAACDSNRAAFFARAAGEAVDWGDVHRCADGEYSIIAPAWLAAEDAP